MITAGLLAGWLALGTIYGPANPLGGNGDFNAIVEGNATLTSTESEGPIAVGGNLTLGGIYNIALNDPGTYVVPGDTAPTGLLVGGRLDIAGSSADGIGRVLQNTYTHLGDMTGVQQRNTDDNGATVATHVVATGDAYDSVPRLELTTTESSAVGPVSALDFASAFAAFRDRSTALAQCPATIQPPVITLVDGRTNVLELTGDELNALSELTFADQPTATAPLLINVRTGASFDWESPNLAGIGDPQGRYILWNFPDATTIRHVSGDTVVGAVYAPRASFTDIDASNLSGSIVVRELLHGTAAATGGELHYEPFEALLECGLPQPTPSPTGPPPPPTGGAESPGAAPLPVTGDGTGGLVVAALLLLSVGFGLHQLARRLRDRAR